MKLVSIRPLLVVALLVAAGGCADMINTSQKSASEGQRLLGERNYGDAAGAFRNAVKQDPRDYRSNYYLATCYEQIGQYQQAIQSYQTALRVMSISLEGQEDKEQFRPRIMDSLALAIARHDEGDVELNSLEEQAKSSAKAEPQVIIAKVYRNRGDADSAIRFYRQAELYEPRNFMVAKEFGLYLADNLKQAKEAEPRLRRAYGLNPDDAQVNEALRQMGIVPGPSLKTENDLVRPAVPRGPLPELKFGKPARTENGADTEVPAAPAGTGGAGAGAGGPRD